MTYVSGDLDYCIRIISVCLRMKASNYNEVTRIQTLFVYRLSIICGCTCLTHAHSRRHTRLPVHTTTARTSVGGVQSDDLTETRHTRSWKKWKIQFYSLCLENALLNFINLVLPSILQLSPSCKGLFVCYMSLTGNIRGPSQWKHCDEEIVKITILKPTHSRLSI